MSKIVHGGRLDEAVAKFGGKRSEWLDLSTGINPNSYPLPEIPAQAWSKLPDSRIEETMLEAARRYYGVDDRLKIVPAPGTQALIQVLPRVLHAKEVTVISPTYGEHAHVWRTAGANVSEVGEFNNLEPSSELCVLVNPNNPDGRVHTVSEIVRISAELECMIVDEAFCDNDHAHSIVLDQPRNVIVLKSFGKFFGLAGLRLGFAICEKKYAEEIREALGPWSVSGPAMEIAAQAFRDEDWIKRTREYLGRASDRLSLLAEEYGFRIEGAAGLFVYVSHREGKEIFEWLANDKILVRPFPERPECLRIGLHKNEEELERLASSLGSYFDRV